MTTNDTIEDSDQASGRVLLRDLAADPTQASRLSRLVSRDAGDKTPTRQFSSSI